MKKWFFVNLKIEIMKSRNKDIKNIFILYEDFVKNPKNVLKYVLKEIGLKFDINMLNFGNKKHHQPGGNFKLRIQTNNSEIKLDEKWKRQMNLKNKVVFNFLFGWLNLFYKLKLKKYDRK